MNTNSIINLKVTGLNRQLNKHVSLYLILIASFFNVFLSCPVSLAQDSMAEDPKRSSHTTDKIPPSGATQLPPSEQVQPRDNLDALLEGVFVKKINVVGSTVFSQADFKPIIEKYENRKITSEQLETLRRELTMYYVKHGYINSGATLPDQTVADGSIVFKIIEGQLTDIEVKGNKWFHKRYIESRIRLDSKPPLNLSALQKRLLLLQQDNRIRRINSELKPGVNPGESQLNVKIDENLPYKASVLVDNYQSPSVGAERAQLNLAHTNLLGFGDTFSFNYAYSEGIDNQFGLQYMIPITPTDTTLEAFYRNNHFSVVEAPFQQIDVRGKSHGYGFGLIQPVYRSINQEFTFTIRGEHLVSDTFLLDDPFNFYEEEEPNFTLRVIQDWIYRSQFQVFALRSRFSFGINNGTGAEFTTWLGQMQWVRRLALLNSQVIYRADLQLADLNIIPLEQIAVGGRYSVRGYRENQLVRDNGFITSLEFRIPIVTEKRWADYIQIAAFVDYGQAWNKKTEKTQTVVQQANKLDISSDRSAQITSAGLGLRWAATLKPPSYLRPEFEIYWGHGFQEFHYNERDFQNDGIHFQFVFRAL